MHIFHKWNTVRRIGKYQYQECSKCGKRRALVMFEGGRQPLDHKWIEGKGEKNV